MANFIDSFPGEIQNGKNKANLKSARAGDWFSSLPLIICGPILRKVYYDNVSVWLAFKEEVADIKLEVFEASSTSAKSAVILSGKASPVQLGKNLFIVLVTAVSVSKKLRADVIYCYSISFRHHNQLKHLSSQNVLKGGITSISYAPYNYPTFCLPADQLNNLKIVHGSCRKPHGGKTDALRGLDTMLEINCTDFRNRPQLLCLTGDQVYADDVADPLLYKIIEAKDQLIGWKETLPGQAGKYKAFQLLPGNRKNIIAKTGNKSTGATGITNTIKVTPDDLTTTDAKSHLIFLSEYILMYLFTFSDTFLSNMRWPGFNDIYKNLNAPGNAEKLREYNDEIKRLNSFVLSLPFVKKALANISCLMIFDDHDVTDDWFITKEWSQAALTANTLSRRYMINGLIAYLVFQDWGNDYKKYLPNNNDNRGNNALKAIVNLKSSYDQQINLLGKMLLPTLETDSRSGSAFLKSPYSWNFLVNYNRFDLLVLNTRTERWYHRSEHPYGSLTQKALPPGRYDFENKLLIMVSAAPVFGNIEMEQGQKEMGEGSRLTKAGLAGRHAKYTGMYEKDQEAWAFSKIGFENLLRKLSMFKKVLILSGDVHYAFTSYIKLWTRSGGKDKLTQIVQSTSSSLKNSTDKTHYPIIDLVKHVSDIPWIGSIPLVNRIPIKGGLVVRTDQPYHFLKILAKKFDKYSRDKLPVKNPKLANIETYLNGNQLLIEPDFSMDDLQYSVQYIQSKNYDVNSLVFSRVKNSAQSKIFTDSGNEPKFQDVIVGKDNISLISFTDHSITNKIWYANGKYGIPDDKESARLLFPYSEHKIILTDKINPDEMPYNQMLKKAFIRSPKRAVATQ